MEYFNFHYVLAVSADLIILNAIMTRRSCQPCSRMWARGFLYYPFLICALHAGELFHCCQTHWMNCQLLVVTLHQIVVPVCCLLSV